MKVLIKPRPELVKIFSKESIKNNFRQWIEPDVDLIFYNDIKNGEIEKTLNEIWYGKNMESIRKDFLTKKLPHYCNKCRPNVIGDLNLIRKSIREYGSLEQVQKKLTTLFKENMVLLEQLYYFDKGRKPPEKKRNLLNKIRSYWI